MIAFLADTAAHRAIDRAIEIIERQRIGSFVASFAAMEGKVPRKGTYEVAYVRPAQLRLRAKLAESDRTYWLTSDQLFAVDHREREWLMAKSPKVGTALQRMAAMVPVDEPVRIMVDPGVGGNFLKTFREIPDWTRSGNKWVAKNGRGKFTLEFDNAGRFASFRADSPTGWISWSYLYPPPVAKPTYPSTQGFKRVDAFYDSSQAASGLPTYLDASSKTVLERAIRSFNRLRQVAYVVDDGTSSTEIWMDGPNFRQKTRRADFSWIGGKLTYLHEGRFLASQRPMPLREVDDFVGKAGSPLDPFLSKLARKQNPLFNLLGPDLKARRVGSMAAAGITSDVLELRGPGIRMTWTVRRDIGLVTAVSSESLDSRGKVLTRSDKRYTYRSVGKPLGLKAPE